MWNSYVHVYVFFFFFSFRGSGESNYLTALHMAILLSVFSHRVPGIYHFRGKQSDTEKTVVYIGTRYFAGKLFVYFCPKLTWPSKTLF